MAEDNGNPDDIVAYLIEVWRTECRRHGDEDLAWPDDQATAMARALTGQFADEDEQLAALERSARAFLATGEREWSLWRLEVLDRVLRAGGSAYGLTAIEHLLTAEPEPATTHAVTAAEPEPAPQATAEPEPAPQATAEPEPAPQATAEPEPAVQPPADPEPQPTTAVGPTSRANEPLAAAFGTTPMPAALDPEAAAVVPQPLEPIPADPVPADPVPAEPVPVEPAPAEAVAAEPAPAEPAPAEPAPAEPVPAEPAPAEAVAAEPAPAEPAPAGAVAASIEEPPAFAPAEGDVAAPEPVVPAANEEPGTSPFWPRVDAPSTRGGGDRPGMPEPPWPDEFDTVPAPSAAAGDEVASATSWPATASQVTEPATASQVTSPPVTEPVTSEPATSPPTAPDEELTEPTRSGVGVSVADRATFEATVCSLVDDRSEFTVAFVGLDEVSGPSLGVPDDSGASAAEEAACRALLWSLARKTEDRGTCYAIGRGLVAVILDRGRPKDVDRLVRRLPAAEVSSSFSWGAARFPDEASDVRELLRMALVRLANMREEKLTPRILVNRLRRAVSSRN